MYKYIPNEINGIFPRWEPFVSKRKNIIKE
jgi:hypothetical protein